MFAQLENNTVGLVAVSVGLSLTLTLISRSILRRIAAWKLALFAAPAIMSAVILVRIAKGVIPADRMETVIGTLFFLGLMIVGIGVIRPENQKPPDPVWIRFGIWMIMLSGLSWIAFSQLHHLTRIALSN